MRNILLFGAGRSATHLIDYLLAQAEQHSWHLTIVDSNIEQAKSKIDGHICGTAVDLDISNATERQRLIKEHDMVISLLPASLHMHVAEDCYTIGRNLCTASYISDEMEAVAVKARKKGLIFMGELGLDPGLDHMSALAVIDDIKAQGGQLTSFKSYTGGLVAPESDTNPWHYKISWNPRNVVLAGRGMATYLLDGRLKYIPYQQLFARAVPVDITGMGKYDMYANRDSLSYRQIYGIEDVQTIIRGTLRHTGYSAAWHALVKLGLTDDETMIENTREMSYADVMQAFIPKGNGELKSRTADYLNVEESSDVMMKLNSLGLFSDENIDLKTFTPARLIEDIIKEKWKLLPDDKDMIIMQHEFEYILDNKSQELKSTLVMEGENAVRTAMSKLVGLPLAIFVKQIMLKKITSVSTARPVTADVYEPILKELEELGVKFVHA